VKSTEILIQENSSSSKQLTPDICNNLSQQHGEGLIAICTDMHLSPVQYRNIRLHHNSNFWL